MTGAMAPLTDFSRWVRGDLLEIVLLILGAILLTRLAGWLRDKIVARIDAHILNRAGVVRLCYTASVLHTRPAHPLGTPAGTRRLAREPVSGHRRYHHVECVRRARAVRRRIGQPIDDLQLLNIEPGHP